MNNPFSAKWTLSLWANKNAVEDKDTLGSGNSSKALDSLWSEHSPIDTSEWHHHCWSKMELHLCMMISQTCIHVLTLTSSPAGHVAPCCGLPKASGETPPTNKADKQKHPPPPESIALPAKTGLTLTGDLGLVRNTGQSSITAVTKKGQSVQTV